MISPPGTGSTRSTTPRCCPTCAGCGGEAAEPERSTACSTWSKLRKGHELLGRIEDAKIALSTTIAPTIALAELSDRLSLDIAVGRFEQAIGPAIEKVVAKAREAVQLAGLAAGRHRHGVPHRRLQRYPEIQGGARRRGSRRPRG